jgi:hypothetical protein
MKRAKLLKKAPEPRAKLKPRSIDMSEFAARLDKYAADYKEPKPDAPRHETRVAQTTIRPDRPGYTSDSTRSRFGGPVPRVPETLNSVHAYDNERHPRQMYRLQLLGISVDQCADVLGISLPVMYKWRKIHPDFAEAWAEGGVHADGKVANALLLKATGWEHQAEKIAIDAKDGSVVRVEYTEKFAPDTAAINLWLTNRQKETWKNQSSKEVTGPGGSPLGAPTIIIRPVMSARQISPVTIDGSSINVDLQIEGPENLY